MLWKKSIGKSSGISPHERGSTHGIAKRLLSGVMAFVSALTMITFLPEPLAAIAATTIDFPIVKHWQDEGNENKRPSQVTVEVYDTANPSSAVKTQVLSSANATDDYTWEYTFTDLPETNGSGETIEYAVREQPVDGYITRYFTGADDHNVTFTLGEHSVYQQNFTTSYFFRIDEDGSIYGYYPTERTSIQSNGEIYAEAGRLYVNLAIDNNLPFYTGGSDEYIEIDGERMSNYFDARGLKLFFEDEHFKKVVNSDGTKVTTGDYRIDTTFVSNVLPLITGEGTSYLSRSFGTTYLDFTDGTTPESKHPIHYGQDYEIISYKLNPYDTSVYYIYLDSASWSGGGIDFSDKEGKVNEIVNVYNKTNVSFEKVWSGDDDQIRPDTITFDLYKDGTIIESKTVGESDGWKGTFDNLTKYESNGKEIAYSVKERSPVSKNSAGYKTTYRSKNNYFNAYKVSFKNVETTDGCPYMDIGFFENSSELTDEGIIGNGKYYYKVSDTANDVLTHETFIIPSNDFYISTGGTFNNWIAMGIEVEPVHVSEEQAAILRRTWKVGDEIAGRLKFANESWKKNEDASLNAPNILDVYNDYDGLIPSDYFKGDIAGEAFHFIYDDFFAGDNDTIIAYNEYDTVDIPVTKIWDDEGYENYRPDSITIQILDKADNSVIAEKTLTKSDKTDDYTWNCTFTGLPKYNADGSIREYLVKEEDTPDGYKVSYSVDDDENKMLMVKFNGFEMNNQNFYALSSGETSIENIPSYVFKLGKSDMLSRLFYLAGRDYVLLENDQTDALYLYLGSITKQEDNDVFDDIEISWVNKDDLSPIDKKAASSKMRYTISKTGNFIVSDIVTPEGTTLLARQDYYDTILTGLRHLENPTVGANVVTNTLERVNIPVKKIWNDTGYIGRRPEKITFEAYDKAHPETAIASVEIYAKGGIHPNQANAMPDYALKEFMQTTFITSDNYTFEGVIYDLPKYDTEDNEIEYGVREKPVPYYKTTYADDGTITNTFELIQVKIVKKWSDNDVEDSRIANISHIVFSIGNKNGGTSPVIEGAIYNPSVEATTGDETVVTAEEAKGKDWTRIKYLDSFGQNHFSEDGTIINLYKYDENGNEIEYVLKETSINKTGDVKFDVKYDGTSVTTLDVNYKADVKTTTNGDGIKVFTITNTADTTSVLVQKTWTFSRTSDQSKKHSVKVRLFANSTAIYTATINDTTVHTFSNLPKYDENGNAISYTVREIETVNGTDKVLNANAVTSDLFEVTYRTDGNLTTINNRYTKKYKVYIRKADFDTKESVSGAVLALYDESGTELMRWTTTNDRILIDNIENGTYTIKELKAPNGYNTGKDVQFTVTDDTTEQSIDFFNEKGFRMPETGGSGLYLVYALSFVMLIAGAIYFGSKTSKKEKE